MKSDNDISRNFGSGAWEFTPEVVEVFDAHVNTHVPNYQLIQDLAVHLSDWFAPNAGRVADVGSATGTTAMAISDRHPQRELDFYLYDVEQEMNRAAERKFERAPSHHRLWTSTTDLVRRDPGHHEADLSLCLFTLQFLSPADRHVVLSRLADRAKPGTGALIVAEKIELSQGLWQEIANEATWDHKAGWGVEAEDIRLKARSLRGVLRPVPLTQLEQEIELAGWGSPVCVYRWFNWGVWVSRMNHVQPWESYDEDQRLFEIFERNHGGTD